MHLVTALRKNRCWTRADLARHAHLNASTVGLIESGRLIPYESQAEKLASALGVTVEVLNLPTSVPS